LTIDANHPDTSFYCKIRKFSPGTLQHCYMEMTVYDGMKNAILEYNTLFF